MWSKVLQFAAWVLTKAWRYGWAKVNAIASWAKNNYVRVYNWIISGIAWETILQWISNIIGW